jgi:iron complex outermembrane receptor protein
MATWNGPLYLTGSVFLNRFKDFIDSVRLPDGTRRYFNVGRAHIDGLELQAQKNLAWLAATLNYTYLDHRNETDDRPLDAQPDHNFNFDVSFFPAKGARLGLYGLLGSTSWWYDSRTSAVLTIPSYFNLDAVAGYTFEKRHEVFVKVGNLFDHYFYTEPGFPWRGRYFEVGIRADLFR